MVEDRVFVGSDGREGWGKFGNRGLLVFCWVFRVRRRVSRCSFLGVVWRFGVVFFLVGKRFYEMTFLGRLGF